MPVTSIIISTNIIPMNSIKFKKYYFKKILKKVTVIRSKKHRTT